MLEFYLHEAYLAQTLMMTRYTTARSTRCIRAWTLRVFGIACRHVVYGAVQHKGFKQHTDIATQLLALETNRASRLTERDQRLRNVVTGCSSSQIQATRRLERTLFGRLYLTNRSSMTYMAVSSYSRAPST